MLPCRFADLASLSTKAAPSGEGLCLAVPPLPPTLALAGAFATTLPSSVPPFPLLALPLFIFLCVSHFVTPAPPPYTHSLPPFPWGYPTVVELPVLDVPGCRDPGLTLSSWVRC